MSSIGRNDLADDPRNRHHSLADWLALHEIDQVTCRGILDAITWHASALDTPHKSLKSGCQTTDPETAWRRTADAMRDFMLDRHTIIDDIFEHTERIVVERRDKSPKGLTIDNGPSAHSTIVFSFCGEPSDFLVVAHEFGHALQIRASGGKFVSPILREVCAFLGESSLLVYARRGDAAQYNNLIHAWERDNNRYFVKQRHRLQAALLQPDTPYKYTWNYPIARYLAMQVFARCSPTWVWSLFDGSLTVKEVLRKLTPFPT